MAGRAVNRSPRHIVGQRRAIVVRLSGDVEQPSEDGIAHRHQKGPALRFHRRAPPEAHGRAESHGANSSLVQLGLDFGEHRSLAVGIREQRVANFRQGGVIKAGVDHCAPKRRH